MNNIIALENFGLIRRQLNKLAINYLKDLPFGPKQIILLRFLKKSNGSSMADVAHAVGSDKAAVTRMVKSLVDQSFLRLEQNSKDSRQKLVYLTPKAKNLIPKVDNIYSS